MWYMWHRYIIRSDYWAPFFAFLGMQQHNYVQIKQYIQENN